MEVRTLASVRHTQAWRHHIGASAREGRDDDDFADNAGHTVRELRAPMATSRWLILGAVVAGCTVGDHSDLPTSKVASALATSSGDPLAVAVAAKGAASPDPDAKCRPAPKVVRAKGLSISPASFAPISVDPAKKFAAKGTTIDRPKPQAARPLTAQEAAAEHAFSVGIAALNSRLSSSHPSYETEYAKVKADALGTK